MQIIIKARTIQEDFGFERNSIVNFTKYPLHKRHSRIHRKEINHMHSTPNMIHKEEWIVQLEVQGAWKARSTGWMFSDDIFSAKNHKFNSLDKAIEFCKYHGLAYQVEIPKSRNPSFKSYSHNFLWKGEPEVDSEDIEE